MSTINWKTTLAGILTGLIPVLQSTSQSLVTGEPMNWFQLLLGVGIMSLGVLARDAKPRSQSTDVCEDQPSLSSKEVMKP